MTWQQKFQPHREYENIDWSDVGRYDYQPLKNKKMFTSPTWNIWRMRLYYVLLFVVAGLAALKGSGLGDFGTLVAILTGVETELKP